MNNIDKIITAINDSSDELKHEVSTFMGYESVRDEGDAIEWCQDMVEDDKIMFKKLWNDLKIIYIKTNYVKEVDISKVQVFSSSGNASKYWFKYKGKHYDIVSSWENWIKK